MLSNVNSSTAAQNNPAPQHSPSNTAPSSGISFTTMLSNEIQAATPPSPPPSAQTQTPQSSSNAQAAQGNQSSGSTQAANGVGNAGNSTASQGSGNAQSGTASGNTSGVTQTASGAATGGKKGPKSTQTSTQDNTAAAAATAAALASVAAGNAAKSGSTKSTTTDPNTTASATSSAQDAANTSATTLTSDQLTNFASTAAASAAAGQARDLSAKAPLGTAANNTSVGATSKGPIAPVAAQTTAAVAPAQVASNQGKNVMQQSSEFSQTLNKISNQEEAPSAKVSPKTDTSVSETAPTTTLPTTTSSAQAGTALANNAIDANGAIQTVRSANQDLSDAQFNAIAPVLNVPTGAIADAAPTESVAPQVGSSGWDEAIGQKISWMVTGGQQSASLTLNPPNLGPLQVTLSLNNQHANATFTSHQPEVRAALESAIPKLREILGQSGIQLGDCNVNSQPKQDFAQNQSNNNGGSSNSASATISTSSLSALASDSGITQRSGVGLVDTFV